MLWAAMVVVYKTVACKTAACRKDLSSEAQKERSKHRSWLSVVEM